MRVEADPGAEEENAVAATDRALKREGKLVAHGVLARCEARRGVAREGHVPLRVGMYT